MTQFLAFVLVLGLSILVFASVGWVAGPAFSGNGSEDGAGLPASLQRME